jgi:soluble lytic murein transglycosylase-like protein
MAVWWVLIGGIGWQVDALERQRAAIERQRAAIERQKISVRRQVDLAPAAEGSFFVTSTAIGEAACDALPLLRQRALVDSAAQRNGLSADLLTAVIQQESAFRPCSVSAKGAMGLMQLMPETAEELGVADAFDPDQNVEAGAALLKELMQRYAGDLNRVLGAYNAGPRKVDKAGGIPAIPETMKYVEGILGKLQKQD